MSSASSALLGLACAAIYAAAPEAYAQAQEPVLTRSDAISRALGDDPRIGAATAATSAAEAGARQAGRRLNPSLDLQRENLEGSGPYRSSERAETTYSLSQRLELGGDRAARLALAERDLDATRLGADIKRLDIIEEVEAAYIDAQAAEASRLIAEERLLVAEDLSSAVRRRVAAARDPLLAGSRAEAQLGEVKIETLAARRTADAARARLASYWAGSPAFKVDMGSFSRFIADAGTADDSGGLRGRLAGAGGQYEGASPDMALAEIERDRASARIGVERARVIPDPDVRMGWRRFSEDDETAFVFGFSVPIGIWDRNADGVARAQADSRRVELEASARQRAISRERARLTAQLDSARLEIEALDASVLPHSEQALTRARDGYVQGGFSYLDVLEAQRALTNARMRRIAALRSYHLADAALARVAGARAGVALQETQR